MLLLALSLQTVPLEDDIGRGPLHMTSQSPFQTLRPGFSPRAPSNLPDHTWELRLTENWANLWAYNEDDYLIDMEVLHSNLTLSRALGKGLRFDVELELGARAGGGMDKLINNVHQAIDAEDRHREEFSENDFQLNLQDNGLGRGSATLSNEDRGFFARALVGTVHWTFSKGGKGKPALSTALSFRAELGNTDELRGGSPVDIGWSFSISERYGPLIVSLSGVVAWFGTEWFEEIPLEPVLFTGLLAIELPLHEDLSLVAQYLCSQGAAKDWEDFSRPSHEILLGFRAGVGERVDFEFGMIENVGIPNNSPDFAFHAGLAYRF